jgi:hypothetical protein
MQTPAWQTSAPSQKRPSSAQGLPSGSGAVQLSVASSHDSAQLASPSAPVHGLPGETHAPPLHTSTPSQKSPSPGQGPVLFVCSQPPTMLQKSSVQGLPSSQLAGHGEMKLPRA